jgi:RimJ/RimL family protein N-acetyltransferase
VRALRPDYPIWTERLALRPYVDSDFDDAAAYWCRDDTTRYLYLGQYTREEFRPRFEQLTGREVLEVEEDVLTLAVVPLEVGRAVGDLTLFWRSERHQQGEIGFILHPDHQGRGYAHEGSMALLRMGFEDLGLHRIVGRLDARNDASAAVLARLGMRREAHLVQNEHVKGEWTDEVIFAMLAEEWRERSAG